MKLEIWSDYACPFCYIGKRRLESALEQFAHSDEVVIEYRSFELQPQSSVYAGKNIHQILAEKHGMSIEQAENTHAGLIHQAAAMGLVYNLDQMKPTNTFDAHRLTQYAKSINKDKELSEELFYAYYTEGKLISEHAILADIAASVGMNREESIAVLRDPSRYATEVRLDESIAQQLKITGAPFYVIDRKYAISGAQPTEVFIKALNQAFSA